MSSRQHRNPHQLFNKILHWSDTKHVKTSLQGHLNLSVWPRTGIWYSFTHTKPHWSVRCLTPKAQAWVTDGRRRARGHGTNTSVYFESHAAGSGACFRFTWRNQIKPFTPHQSVQSVGHKLITEQQDLIQPSSSLRSVLPNFSYATFNVLFCHHLGYPHAAWFLFRF